MAPIREGARLSLSRGWSSLMASVLMPLAFSLVRRSGESWGARKPSRTGRNISEVNVCAGVSGAPRAISAGHAKKARKAIARLRRPVAGPDFTTRIPQRIHALDVPVPEPALASWKTSLTELKQLWLMGG
jgi:hypothetical protein